jgi:hypothetical protein
MASGRPKDGYRNAAGDKVPGVTTICSRFKDSGALLHWAAAQGRLMERGEIKSLYDKRDQAAEAGTLAHDMVFQHLHGDPVTIPETTDLTIAGQAQTAFNAYLSWASMTKLEIVEQEFPLVSEQHQFGGTPDAIGLVNEKLSLVDWKTSNGVYQDYLLQLAAYDLLIKECRPDLVLTGGYHLCRFAKSYGDFAHHYWPELEDAKKMFLMLRECYDIDKILKKRHR